MDLDDLARTLVSKGYSGADVTNICETTHIVVASCEHLSLASRSFNDKLARLPGRDASMMAMRRAIHGLT